MGGLSRKNFVKATKTLTFAAGGTDYITMTGRFNQINGSVRGTITRSGTGAVTAKDCLEEITRFQVISTKYGTVCDIDGAQLYWYSRARFGSAAFTTVGTGTSVTNVGFEFSLPITCDSDESLTVYVTWSALTGPGTLITANSSVLRLNAELIPNEPEWKFGFRKQIAGANGVIGANTIYSQPMIPQIGDGWELSGCLIETDTTARGTLTSALDTIQLLAGFGNYIIDDNATLLQHTFAVDDVPIAIIAGIYPLHWHPFKHEADTILNLGNGAAATVDGSEVMYEYVMVKNPQKSKVGSAPATASPAEPAPQPRASPSMAATQPAAPRAGGIPGSIRNMMNPPARPVSRFV